MFQLFSSLRKSPPDGREKRIAIFNETMELCRRDPLLKDAVEQSCKRQYIEWQTDPLPPVTPVYMQPASLVLSSRRTMEAARPYAAEGRRVCVLNFASSVTPGGGVTRGATAQEESMCRISTLYPALTHADTAGAFYARHWRDIDSCVMGRENADDCIYTPGVVVLREDDFDCALLPRKQWYKTNVITCAAPDLRYSEGGKPFHPSAAELVSVFENRFRRILSVAAANRTEVLILGAFGCGAFKNPPELVAKAFANVFEQYSHCFQTVEFAVFCQSFEAPNYQAFASLPGIRELRG